MRLKKCLNGGYTNVSQVHKHTHTHTHTHTPLLQPWHSTGVRGGAEACYLQTSGGQLQMTPEDKAHLTPVLSSLRLLCHLKLKQCRTAFARGSLFSSAGRRVQTRQRQIDKQAERYEAIFPSRGAAGYRTGRGLKWFTGQLIGLI